MINYINTIIDGFIELKGDRKSGDDNMVLCGLGRIAGQKCVIISYQSKENGNSFDLPSSDGYRKSLRLMNLAESFNKPIIILVDIQKYYHKQSPEQQRIDEAIIKIQETTSQLNIPIIAIITGIHNSIFSFELCTADRILIAENSDFIVPLKNGSSSDKKIKADEFMALGLIDRIISFSLENIDEIKKAWQNIIIEELQNISAISKETLIEQRVKKFQSICSNINLGG